MASPAKIALQGESSRKLRPSDSMSPSEGVGGWVPRPRKESEASTRIAADSSRLVCTRITRGEIGQDMAEDDARIRAPMARAPAT